MRYNFSTIGMGGSCHKIQKNYEKLSIRSGERARYGLLEKDERKVSTKELTKDLLNIIAVLLIAIAVVLIAVIVVVTILVVVITFIFVGYITYQLGYHSLDKFRASATYDF